MSVPKCKAKGGPAACRDPKCPEKLAVFAQDFRVPSTVDLSRFRPRQPAPTPGAWSDKDTVLLRTIHGSRLYGLNHAGSDEDYYVVTPTVHTKRQINAKHKIDGVLDTVVVDFASFTKMADMGVPQALETMFSQKNKSEFFEDYRTGYRTSSSEVLERYLRTMKAFSLTEEAEPKAFKYRRHAMRLSLNLNEMLHTGRFNPTLSWVDAERITRLAEFTGPKYFRELNALQPVELNWETWLAERDAKKSS